MNEIQEYNGVEAALSEIRSKYAGRVYDVTTKTGLADAKLARREVRSVRTGLEKLRTEIKAPAWARCKAIDDEAKRITAELLKIEQPIDEVIAAEELRVETEKQERLRAEALRVAGIKERIELMNVMPAWGEPAARIMQHLHEVSGVPIDDTFAEFKDAAAIVKAQAMARLTTMHAEAKAIEDEQEKLRVLQAETEARMAREREANEARLAEERKRAECERQERIETQRKLDEQAAEERNRLAEEARIAREGQQLAEQAREQEALLAAKHAAEQAERAARDLAIEQAKAHSSEEALQRVADVVDKWTSDQIDAEAAMDEIELIVAANA